MGLDRKARPARINDCGPDSISREISFRLTSLGIIGSLNRVSKSRKLPTSMPSIVKGSFKIISLGAVNLRGGYILISLFICFLM
jgi:hypothetical protein